MVVAERTSEGTASVSLAFHEYVTGGLRARISALEEEVYALRLQLRDAGESDQPVTESERLGLEGYSVTTRRVVDALRPAGRAIPSNGLIARLFPYDLKQGFTPDELRPRLRSIVSVARRELRVRKGAMIASVYAAATAGQAATNAYMLLGPGMVAPQGWRTEGTYQGNHLSLATMREVARLLEQPLAQYEIAARCGVSSQTVSEVLQGLHWSVRDGHLRRPVRPADWADPREYSLRHAREAAQRVTRRVP